MAIGRVTPASPGWNYWERLKREQPELYAKLMRTRVQGPRPDFRDENYAIKKPSRTPPP